MTSVARSERIALARLMDELGPDAPTLCAGWATRDLAAHLVLRERRPDAAAGIVVGRLAGWTRRVQDRLAGGDYSALVARVRSGPPVPLGPLDQVFNSAEFFVHHEDVRRAQPGWAPRPTDPELEDAMWRTLTARAPLMFRRSPVGVVLRLPDGTASVAHKADRPVTLTGPATELTLYAFGRTEHAYVEVDGDPKDVKAFRGTSLSV
jgi:uncharacterized protein (TIGR03085 family)